MLIKETGNGDLSIKLTGLLLLAEFHNAKAPILRYSSLKGFVMSIRVYAVA